MNATSTPPATATTPTPRVTRRDRTVLHVDWTRCDGHGSCAELVPSLLKADAWGFPIATGERIRGDVVVPASELEHARRAVAACPLMALRLFKKSP